MNILVIGGGGREHAIIKALKKNKDVEQVYCLPGNGGIQGDAECYPVGAKNIPLIVHFAETHKIDYAVVAQDDPLALGCVDALNALGIPCFGPDKKAARIEASKVFAKELMKKYGIPTAKYEVFTEARKAIAYVESCPIPTVVKADGLALGKGVTVCMTREEAKKAVVSCMEDKAFGEAGRSIVRGQRAELYGRGDRRSDGIEHGPQARPRRRRGAEHRRYGHYSPESVLHPPSRRRVHGKDFYADDPRYGG